MKTFEAGSSLMTQHDSKEIWRRWTDIASWPTWEGSIDVKIDGPFEVGSTISCYSEGEEDPRRMTLIAVDEDNGFTDRTDLPLGCIKTIHEMRSIDGNVQVTHRMVAEIDEDGAAMFGREIWPHIQDGLAEGLNKMISR